MNTVAVDDVGTHRVERRAVGGAITVVIIIAVLVVAAACHGGRPEPDSRSQKDQWKDWRGWLCVWVLFVERFDRLDYRYRNS